MSDKDFVFRVGPLAAGTEEFIYYVFPGQPGNYAFAGRDDAAIWPQITKDYDAASLVCEPLLDTSDKPDAVAVAPYDRNYAHAIAVMTYENLEGAPLSEVLSEGLISDFVIAARDYLQSRYVTSGASLGALSASFEGEPGIETGADLEEPEDRRARLRFRLRDASGERIAFGVEFHDGPAFAVDAMRRGFGLDAVPMPVVETASGRDKPDDTIMLLLISALTALSRMEPGTTEGKSRYRMRDMRVACVIK
jgi:hypothetical protein